MARYTIEGSTLLGIANAIRGKNESAETYTPEEMIEAIEALNVGGGIDADSINVDVNENGVITVSGAEEELKTLQLSIAQDKDFKSDNIRQGVNLFGIDGTMAAGAELNFSVVGGLPISVGGGEDTSYTLTNLLSKEIKNAVGATAGNPLSESAILGTYTVEVGHTYYIRAISSTYGVFTWGGGSTVLYNNKQLTTQNAGANHVLWTADTTTLTIKHSYTSQCAAGASAGTVASLYMVVDVTSLVEEKRQTPDIFWANIEQTIFYGDKTFGAVSEPILIPPINSPTENTIWVNTDTEINSWAFVSEAPGSYQADVNVIDGLESAEGYFSSTGAVTAGDGTNKPHYCLDYIPVSVGEKFVWDFAFPSNTSRAIWLAYCTYDSTQKFISRTVLVNGVAGASTSVEFTIPSGVAYIRVTFRTFSEVPNQSIVTRRTLQDEVDNGLAWFRVAPQSIVPINALKENELYIYPIACSQYVDGAWVDKNVSIYQKGEWQPLMQAFLYGSSQFENITGGWECNGIMSGAGILLEASNSASWTQHAYTKNAIDLTNIHSLHFDITSISNYNNTWIRCSVSTTPNEVANHLARLVPTKSGINTLDVSSISGKVYINIHAGNTSTIMVHSITWE